MADLGGLDALVLATVVGQPVSAAPLDVARVGLDAEGAVLTDVARVTQLLGFDETSKGRAVALVEGADDRLAVAHAADDRVALAVGPGEDFVLGLAQGVQ